jgi:hypothetical protein
MSNSEVEKKVVGIFTDKATKFAHEITSIFEDYKSISDEKFDKGKAISQKMDASLDISTIFDSLGESKNEYLKFKQFRIAMFNHMYSVFERNLNDIIQLSLTYNEGLRKIIRSKFIRFDEERIRNKKESWRSSKYEDFTVEEKNKLYMEHYAEFISHDKDPGEHSVLNNWMSFFGISDKKMLQEKHLKYDFSELKERRNLLVHRGILFDAQYINSLKNQLSNPKKYGDFDARVKFYSTRNFFTFDKDVPEINSINDLDLLLEKNVSISNTYFLKSMVLLFRLYLLIANEAVKTSSISSNFSHELLILSKKTNLEENFVIESMRILDDYIRNNEEIFVNASNFSEDDEFFIANYLLASSKFIKLMNKDLKKETLDIIKNRQTAFIQHFESKKDIAIYQLLLCVIGERFDEAILCLKKCTDLRPSHKDWYIFYDLKKHPKFDATFNKLFKHMKLKKKKP